MSLRALRKRIYRQLEPREIGPLPLAKKLLIGCILLAGLLAILETEAVIAEDPTYRPVIALLNHLLFAVFIAEYALRLWTAPESPCFAPTFGRLRWALQWQNLLDLFVLFVFLASLFAPQVYLLRLLPLSRLLVLARLARFKAAGAWLVGAIRTRAKELLLSVFDALAVLLGASVLLFVLEGRAQPEAFGSIPWAMWLAVETLTIVGYGDVYPLTPLGRIAAACIAFIAIGLIALPAGILAGALSEAFEKGRQRRDAGRAVPETREPE